MVKSSGWTFGGPTVYRFMGRVLGLLLALIFGTVFTSLIVKVYASKKTELLIIPLLRWLRD